MVDVVFILALNALLQVQLTSANFGSLGQGPVTVGGFTFMDDQLESLTLFLFEELRDRPTFTPGATNRKCEWKPSASTGVPFCSGPRFAPSATASCIQQPAPLYGRCTGRFLKAEEDGCPDGCEFQKFSDDDVIGFCGLPGGPEFAAADLQILIDCDDTFPNWSGECEESQVKFILSQGGGEAYANEVRDVYMCQRQSSEDDCNAVVLPDCSPPVHEYRKCSGSRIPGVLCCEEDTECFKKNEFYGQCRNFADVPSGWDGSQQDCFL